MYTQMGRNFLFEKEERIIPFLLNNIQNGVIKEYRDFYLLEQIPETIGQHDFDWLMIDGKQVTWAELPFYTKDRMRALLAEEVKGSLHTVSNWREKRFDPDEIADILSTYEPKKQPLYKGTFSSIVMNMELQNF